MAWAIVEVTYLTSKVGSFYQLNIIDYLFYFHLPCLFFYFHSHMHVLYVLPITGKRWMSQRNKQARERDGEAKIQFILGRRKKFWQQTKAKIFHHLHTQHPAQELNEKKGQNETEGCALYCSMKRNFVFNIEEILLPFFKASQPVKFIYLRKKNYFQVSSLFNFFLPHIRLWAEAPKCIAYLGLGKLQICLLIGSFYDVILRQENGCFFRAIYRQPLDLHPTKYSFVSFVPDALGTRWYGLVSLSIKVLMLHFDFSIVKKLTIFYCHLNFKLLNDN